MRSRKYVTLPLAAVLAGVLTSGFGATAHSVDRVVLDVETPVPPAQASPVDGLLDTLLRLIGGLLGGLPGPPPRPALPVAAGAPEQLPPLSEPLPTPPSAPEPAVPPLPSLPPLPQLPRPLPDPGSLLPGLLPPVLPPAPAQQGAPTPARL